MQIQLHTDHHTDGSQSMAEHVETTVRAALGRFGARVARIDVFLSDADGSAKSGAGAIHCVLDARLVGLEAVVVSELAPNSHQAIQSGVRKLKRAVGAALSKQDPRHLHARAAAGAEATRVDEPEGLP